MKIFNKKIIASRIAENPKLIIEADQIFNDHIAQKLPLDIIGNVLKTTAAQAGSTVEKLTEIVVYKISRWLYEQYIEAHNANDQAKKTAIQQDMVKYAKALNVPVQNITEAMKKAAEDLKNKIDPYAVPEEKTAEAVEDVSFQSISTRETIKRELITIAVGEVLSFLSGKNYENGKALADDCFQNIKALTPFQTEAFLKKAKESLSVDTRGFIILILYKFYKKHLANPENARKLEITDGSKQFLKDIMNNDKEHVKTRSVARILSELLKIE